MDDNNVSDSDRIARRAMSLQRNIANVSMPG